MSLRYKRKTIEDVVSEGVDQGDVDILLNFLLSVISKIAPTLARRAEFHLGDFSRMNRLGLDDFTLSLRADCPGAAVIWEGEFVGRTRRLRAVVSLED